MTTQPKSSNVKILIAYPNALIPVRGGGPARVLAMASFLKSNGCHVVSVSCDNAYSKAKLSPYFNDSFFFSPKLRIKWNASNNSVIEINRNIEFDGYVREILQKVEPDAVIAQFAWSAGILHDLPKHILRILDTHDIQSERAATAREHGRKLNAKECSWKEEQRELRKAQVLIAIQHDECRELKRRLPQKEVLCAMHSIPAEPAPSPERSKDLLFVGNRYDPNIQGMQLFLEECWPDILNQIPDAQLHVCGTICRDIATCSTTRNITLHDVVPDLTPFYRQAAVIINPVCYGTGLPIKTLEAMSFGKCVVGMAAAVRGFPKEPSPPVSVARTISGMTDQITPLLTKPELRHEQETQVTKYINEHMSPSEVYGALLSRLQQHNTNQKHGQTITASSLMSRIKNYYFRTAIRHELRRLCNRYFSPIHPAQTLSPAFVKAHVRQVWRLLNVDHAYQRVALFGAGDHTQWLQHCVQHDDGPTVTAIIDDKPSDRQLFDLPVTRSDSFSPETCDAIVLSSDCWQAPMLQRCRELFGKEVPIVDLYDNLPPGPYRK